MASIFDYGWYVEEHFVGDDSVADAEVGQNGWEIDIISGGGGHALLRNG